MNPDDPLGLIQPQNGLTPQGDPLGLLGKSPKRKPKIGQAGKAIVEIEPEPKNDDKEVLGGISALARDIPGAEAIQAVARTAFRTEGGHADLTTPAGRAAFAESYRESLDEIRKAEESAPGAVRFGNRVIGATTAAAALPLKGSLPMQGFEYGAARGALKADPVGVGDRAVAAAKEGTIDAIGAKVAQGLGLAARTIFSKSMGRIALERKAAMEAADVVNYGKAMRESELAAANPTPAAVSTALSEPDIKPYAAAVRNSRSLQGANPGRVLSEVYKLLSERQGLLGKRILNSDDFKAGSQLEQQDIGAAKRVLVGAADHIMPSFKPAVYAHADLSRQREAFIAGADATNRLLKNSTGAARKLEKNSPEAFKAAIDQMTPEEAKAAIQGLVARLKSRAGDNLTVNPLKLFGVPREVGSFTRPISYLEPLEAKAGIPFSRLLGRAGMVTAASSQ